MQSCEPEQWTRHRYAVWLQAYERGLREAVGGETRRLSVAEIARFCGVSPRAVRYGLAVARELRARIEEEAM